MEFTGNVKVWLTNNYRTYAEMEQLRKDGAFDELASSFHYTNAEMEGHEGWTLVGNAVISVTLDTKEEIIKGKVTSMRAEIQGIRAVARRKVERLEDRIQSMLALPNPEQGAE